jgi:hypothetical protein
MVFHKLYFVNFKRNKQENKKKINGFSKINPTKQFIVKAPKQMKTSKILLVDEFFFFDI